MKIALSSKKELGFINGTVTRDEEDRVKGDLWDTCNDTVIGWIMGIKQTIMYMLTSGEIWLYLERRFSISNGSLKYKLNKELYETKQGSLSINEYYTMLKSVWEELESLDQLPSMTTTSEDVTKFLEALEKQKEENRLFQFLNGLDEAYGP